MKHYHGWRQNDRCFVNVNDEPLNPRHDLVNHSPDGFEWGYGGSGPAQLALAILADLRGGDFALKFYKYFKQSVIASLPMADWTLTDAKIEAWLRDRFLSIWTVYSNPKDFPGKWVARRFLLDWPEDETLVADSLEELRRQLPQGLHHQPRLKNDDPVIVETWF